MHTLNGLDIALWIVAGLVARWLLYSPVWDREVSGKTESGKERARGVRGVPGRMTVRPNRQRGV